MRVTLDYDGTGFRSKYLTVFSWFVLKILSRGAQYGRKSADSGYHLKCHGLRISFKLSLLIRFLLLEDGHRSLFDMQRLKKPKAILWSHKDGKSAGRWCKCLKKVLF
jgi:hypothetical protein